MNKIIQDMIPAKNKPPLREALPMERKRKMERRTEQPGGKHIRQRIEKEKAEKNERKMPVMFPQEPARPSRGIIGKRTVKPWLFALIALICLGAIAYGFSIVYAKATVAVTPASIDIPVSGSYTAYENSNASGTLAYQIIQANGYLSQTVSASIGPAVKTFAKGTVILYNNYGSASQRIVAGTRLESGNGLIYTTDNAVNIPGIVKGVAGSVAVDVTAAAGGSAYNILPSDLTVNPSYGDLNIVAYKGTARYSGFYARLNPNGAGITGGSAGNQIITSSSSVAAADQVMEQSLQKSLLAQAQVLVPANSVMFNNAYSINYLRIAASTTSSTTANVGIQASFYGIIFNKDSLAQAIAPTQYNTSFDPQDLESDQFTIDNTQAFSMTNAAPLNFSLQGTMNLVGTFSTTTLARQLAGISLAQSSTIFKGYGTIATAHVTIVPFWKRSFPSSPSRINVVIQQN